MSKPNTLIMALVGLLALSVLASIALCIFYVRAVGLAQTLQPEEQRLEAKLMLVNRNRSIVRSMVDDALEYSKRNAAIDPLLQQFSLKPKPTAAAPARPAGH